jgi:hypothetical protein
LILATKHYLFPLTAVATFGNAEPEEPGRTRIDLCNGDTIWITMTLDHLKDVLKDAARNGEIIQYLEVDPQDNPA